VIAIQTPPTRSPITRPLAEAEKDPALPENVSGSKTVGAGTWFETLVGIPDGTLEGRRDC